MATLYIGAKMIRHIKYGFTETVKRYENSLTERVKEAAIEKLKNKYLSQKFETYTYQFYGKGIRNYKLNFPETKYRLINNTYYDRNSSIEYKIYTDENGDKYYYSKGYFDYEKTSNIVKLIIDGQEYLIDKVITKINISKGEHQVRFVTDFEYSGICYKTQIKLNKPFNIYIDREINCLSILATFTDGYGKCYLTDIGRTGPRNYYGYYEDEYRLVEKLQDLSIDASMVSLDTFKSNHVDNYYTYEIKLPAVQDTVVMKEEVKTTEVNKPEIKTTEVNKPEIKNTEVNKPEIKNTVINEHKKEEYKNGYYIGDFVRGVRQGKGQYYWTNGGSYDGDWYDGDMHGYGIRIYADGDKYEGYFNHDKRHGQGTMYYSDGTIKKGEWKNGEFVGGTVTSKNTRIDYGKGVYYVGEVRNNAPHGKGTYYWNQYTRYEGDFYNGMFHGKGIIYYPDGTSDIATYKENNLVSKESNIITKIYSDGKYEGTFKNDLFHGVGTYMYNNGCMYKGNFDNGQITGKGTFSWPNKNRYSGRFLNGQFEGEGTFYYYNGDYYSGQWHNGKFHGKGAYHYANGVVKEGNWANGEFVENNVKEIKKEVKKETVKQDLKKQMTLVSNTKVDINSNEFKEAMKIFSYKVKENGEVVISSCKNPPKKIVIPEGVTTIYTNAFYNNKPEQIEEVVIANSVVKIQAKAFFGCKNIRKLTLGSSLQEIGKWAFINSKIDELYIPDNVKTIGDWAFNVVDDGFKGSVSLPKTCKLGQKVFSSCYDVKIR